MPWNKLDMKFYFKTEVLDNTSKHYVRLHREAIEIHKHQQSFNKNEESLKLNKAWLPALKNTACKRTTNSTQPQGPRIIAQKRPAKDTHQSQWQIISPPYHNNTSTTKTHWSPYLLKRTKAVPTAINTQLSNKQQQSMDRVPTPVLWRCQPQRLAKHQKERPSEHGQRAWKNHNNH